MDKHVAAVHEEKKPFKCDSCDYHCSLKIHMKTHSHCNTFTLHWFMKKRNHSNVTFVTKYSFKLKSHMKTHVASVHERKKPFKCHIWDYGCFLKTHLNKHVALIHERKKPFKCDICNYSCSLKQHIKKHTFQQFMKERNHPNVTFVTTIVL